MKFRFLLVGLVCLACPAQGAENASTEDTAKFLAGLPVSADSPLASLEDMASAKQNKSFFDSTFERVDRTQISKVRDFAAAHVDVHRSTLFYFFSGPDFLYANAFFPDATTYVLCGLESPGTIPDLTKLPKDEVSRALRALEGSLRSILGLTFFQTKFMSGDFHRSKVTGTIPVLYIFMARSSKEVHSATLVQLNEDGAVSTDVTSPRKGAAKGVKITFSSPGGPEQTLYYFATNVAGGSFKSSGLEAFADKLGRGDAFIKSASYLLQGRDFSDIRNFIMTHADAILQDDTGVPIDRFDKSWTLTPYGNYVGPIGLFRRAFQPRLAMLHRKSEPQPIDFSISYQYRPHRASLVWAVKQGTPSEEARPAAAEAKPAAAEAKPASAEAQKPAAVDEKPAAKAEEKPAAKPKTEIKAPADADAKPNESKQGEAKPGEAKSADSKAAEKTTDESKASTPEPGPTPETTTVPKTDSKPLPPSEPAPASKPVPDLAH